MPQQKRTAYWIPWVLSVALATIAACVTPTDVCGCVALPSILRVVGTVRDQRGIGVTDVRVSILNRSVGFPNERLSTAGQVAYTTNSLGRFSAETSSPVPGQYEVRGSVVRRGASDTVPLVLGVRALRSPSGPVDTIVVDVVLP